MGKLVYSTDIGRIKEKKTEKTVVGNGKVQVVRDTRGRRGKVVTLIKNLPLNLAELSVLAKKLKQRSGGGGTVKEGNIELQGDHVELAVQLLEQEGFT